MKKDKPVRPEPVRRIVPAPVVTEIPAADSPLGHKVPKHRPLKFVSTAHSIAPGRKSHGCLNRDTLNRLGKALESSFNGIRNEGVPDRLKALLLQYEDRNHQDMNNNKRSS